MHNAAKNDFSTPKLSQSRTKKSKGDFKDTLKCHPLEIQMIPYLTVC